MDSSRVVHPGACFVGDELMRCSLWDGACGGMTYKSHRELVGTEHAQTCNTNEYSYHIGMCASEMEKFLCTGHESNCALPYVDHVPQCNLKHNHFPQRELPYSLYGKCLPNDTLNPPSDGVTRAGICVWARESCPEQDHTFEGASVQLLYASKENENDLCTCDKVKVGACVHTSSNYFACAVSASSCDVESNFYQWDQLVSSGKDCRLCDAFDKSATIHTFTIAQSSQQEAKCNVVGASIGGIVVGVVITALTSFLMLRRRYVKKDCVPRNNFGQDGILLDLKAREISVWQPDDDGVSSLDSQVMPANPGNQNSFTYDHVLDPHAFPTSARNKQKPTSGNQRLPSMDGRNQDDMEEDHGMESIII